MAKQKNNDKESKTNKRNNSGCIVFAIIVFLFFVLCVIGGLYKFHQYKSDVMNSPDTVKEVDVTIEEGSSVTKIAEILEDNGVIDDKYHFLYLCKKNNCGTDFHAGIYTFTNNMTFEELSDMLKTGTFNAERIKFTIKEGQWVSEIAASLAATGFCTADEFLEACNSSDYDYDFVKAIPQRDNLLEGYLYPETYFLDKDWTAHDFVDVVLNEFDKNIPKDFRNGLSAKNITLDEAVIVGSLIENEVMYPEERTTVASVIYNRINKGMKLQLDASVLYALGNRKSRVLYSDLEIEDEHNTYYVNGLPIGPIGNPSKECIFAAANPDKTDYIYYVLEDTQTGQHYFTADYNDFLKAKDKYLSSK